jgi:glycosyltransferase involved in cell wall biosynthesis
MGDGGRRISVALVGTRGVPARYGGFETCVEEVGSRLAARGHDVLVYCRTAKGDERPAEHQGMRLVHRGAMRRRSLETLSHTGLSVAHLLRHRTDAAIVFNAANSPYLPALRAARIPVATHVDGLEWRRAKWGRAGQAYYRTAESLAVRWSDALIADAQGIADYYHDEFGAPTELIAYGAPVVETGDDVLAGIGLQANGYHLVVARFEPENHVDMIVEGYVRSGSEKALVVVGSAPYAEEYSRRVRAAADDRVRFLGGVWDQRLLDQLYAGAATYLHGHSVGGTNPSLLRALGAGAAVIAYDVAFNREVAGGAAAYFRDASDVAAAIDAADAQPAMLAARRAAALHRAAAYDWDDVADRYEDLCLRLAAHEVVRPARPLGSQRTGAAGRRTAERRAGSIPTGGMPGAAR